MFVVRGLCIPRCLLAHMGFSGGRLVDSGGRAGETPSTCTERREHTRARCVHRMHTCTNICALKARAWPLHTPSGAGLRGDGAHLTLLFRWSAAGSSRARPAGTGGPVGSGCCWKMSSGVRSTSVGLTMTFAAESRAVLPLL